MNKYIVTILILLGVVAVAMNLENYIISVLSSFVLGGLFTIAIIEWAIEFFLDDDGKEEEDE